MSRRFPWNTLGIAQTHDRAAIRKAYADALRAINVDEDIAAYAELRRARDEALWLAAQSDRPDTDDFGLGTLDNEAADFDDDWHDAPEGYHPEPSPDGPNPELSEAQRRAQDAWQALLDILYPGGEASEDSVTYHEMEEGLAHLSVLLDHAQQTDLVEHDALDGALADVFARTWPRSAPFVEPANAALHWLDEAGSLEERPALMFLNQRLKGMRFHEKVQVADHPLHKAWAELSRPGSASMFDRLRVKRLEIDKLLTGVRSHFPELESFLDPQRVASWEGNIPETGVSGTGPKVVRGIFIVLLVLAVPRLIANFTDPRPDNPAIAAAALINQGPSADEIDAQVTDIFGPDMIMNAVRATDPVFADQLRNAFNMTAYSNRTPLAFVRGKAVQAGEVADFDALVARAELRRLWLTAAARQSDEVCQNVLMGDFNSVPLDLNEKQRVRESALLRQLLNAQVLQHQAKGGPTTYAIPGWVVGEMITRSGLSEDAVRKAMSDTANPNRCKVEIALLDVAIASSGRVSAELLRGL